MRLRDTRAAVPLPALNHWLPLPARGLLALNLSNAKIAGSELRELQGEIVWQQASWQWSTRWLELGDYRGQLQMEQAPKLHGVIEGKGALALNGQIDIDWKEKKYDVQAQLIANESLPKEFRDGLTLLLAAKQDAQGHYQVRRNGGW
jgi:hypothetical protein